MCFRLPVSLALSAGLLAACAGQPPSIELGVAAVAPALRGDARLDSSSGVRGDDLDLDHDLALGDRELEPYLTARIDIDRWHLSASGFSTSTSGAARLSGAFGDLPAGTDVDTDFDLIQGMGTLTADLLFTGPLRLGAGIGLDVLDAELEVRSQTLGTERVRSQATVPLLVGAGELDLGPLRILLSVGAMTGKFQDSDGPFFDGELTARVSPFSWSEFFVGYRYQSFTLEGRSNGQEFELDMQVDGFLTGLTIRF